MSFVAVCESCQRKHKCRDAARGKKVKCRGCGKAFVAEDNSVYGIAEELPKLPPRRNVKVRHKRKRRGKDSDESSKPATEIRNLLIAAGVGALGFVVPLFYKLFATPLIPQVALGIGFIGFSCAYDQYCRHRIRKEIESFDGTITRISWLPFQGAFFSRGWRVERFYRFYNVEYVENGRKRSEMCGVSWLLGNRWEWD